nr:MAG TPA: hypothetical protein [Caudoviricetes sp.]
MNLLANGVQTKGMAIKLIYQKCIHFIKNCQKTILL